MRLKNFHRISSARLYRFRLKAFLRKPLSDAQRAFAGIWARAGCPGDDSCYLRQTNTRVRERKEFRDLYIQYFPEAAKDDPKELGKTLGIMRKHPAWKKAVEKEIAVMESEHEKVAVSEAQRIQALRARFLQLLDDECTVVEIAVDGGQGEIPDGAKAVMEHGLKVTGLLSTANSEVNVTLNDGKEAEELDDRVDRLLAARAVPQGEQQ